MPSMGYPPREPQPEFDKQDIEHVQNLELAPNSALWMAAGQLAIMSATPEGQKPDRLLERMLSSKREGKSVLEYLKEGSQAWVCQEVPGHLTKEEKEHLRAALDVVWLIEDAVVKLHQGKEKWQARDS